MSGAWQGAFFALTLLTALVAFGFLALARHVAALETRMPQPVPLELSQGPAIGAGIEERLADAGLRSVIGTLREDGLLVFVTTSCAACQQVVVDLTRFARENRTQAIAVVIAGPMNETARLRSALGAIESYEDSSGRAMSAFGVRTVPYAFLIRDRAVAAKGIVNNLEMLESLALGAARRQGDSLLASLTATSE